MKTNGMSRRLLAFIMAAVICLSLVPWTVFAADADTYTQVTDLSELSAGGEFILVAKNGESYAAVSTAIKGKPDAVSVTVSGTELTGTDLPVWTIAPIEGGGISMYNGSAYLKYNSSTNLGSSDAAYDWTVSEQAEGTFRFVSTQTPARGIAYQISGNRFGGYAVSNASNADYVFDLLVFKKSASGTITPDPEPTPDPGVETVDIATALAGENGTEFTVKGVVTLVDGSNIYLQDATGGICVRMSSAPSDISLGDTIIGTGSKTVYNGLPQLGSGSYEKSSGLTLTAKETTIGALTTADIATYIKLTGVEVTEVYDNNGSYSAPNITVTDGTNTIQIYKAVVGKTNGAWDVKVGDKLDVTAAVGVYNTTLQLRNTLNSEFTITTTEEIEPSEPEIPEDPAGISWTKVELSDITAADTIAITMTKGEDTWALYNGNGTSSAPTAVVVTVDGSTMTSAEADTLAWNIASGTDGVVIYKAGTTDTWLYSTNTNNGVRVGSNDNKHWSISAETGHLVHNGTGRYMGVYIAKPDWRAYTSVNNNITGQVLSFWKLNSSESEEPETPAWTDVEEKYSIYEQVSTLTDGDVVVIYNPGNSKALSSQDSGYYKAGVDAAVTENYIASDADLIEWTVSIDENGVYTFTQGELTLGIEQSGTYFNLKTASGDTGWTLRPTAEGSSLYYMYSSTLEGSYGHVYLEWYASKNAFSSYCTGEDKLTEKEFGFGFYKLVREGVEEEEPEEPAISIKDGDKVVIWAPAYNKALSTEKTGYYNVGVDVTVTDGVMTGYGESEIWTVIDNGDGTWSFENGGQNIALAASNSSMNLGEINDTWTITALGGDLYNIQNVGRGNYMEWYNQYGNWSTYNSSSAATDPQFQLSFYVIPDETTDPEPASGIADGDYVIWAPAYNMALSTIYPNGSYYNAGVELTVDGDKISGYENTEIWTVTNNADGTITISCAGGKLSMDTGYSSMPLNKVNDTWTIEDAGNGLWYVKNVGRECYIEWYASNKYWSGYYNISAGSEGMFALKFTPVEKGYDTDPSIVDDIAQWGGGYSEEAAAKLYADGDKYVAGDKLDTEAQLTVMANGAIVSPYYLPGSNGYMGGQNVGAKAGDYVQLAFSGAGWGDMELSFRIRATNAGPGSFQLCYSTDNGESWQNFTTGSYAYAYTGWNSEGSYPITGEGTITDGVAKTSLAPAEYVSFVFDVPAGADNCGNLLIRLIPGTERASGTGAVGGNIRMDTVVVSGRPIVDASITGFVTVTPDGEEDQAVGTQLTMESATEGAAIYYRVNGGQWQTYNAANKPALETLPCDIEAYAVSEGKADSVVLPYHYAAGTVENVKFSPNGGGIYIEGESAEITLSTATEGATIYYATSADGETFTDYAVYAEPIVVEEGFGKLVIRAYAEKEGFTTSTEVEKTFTERSSAEYNIYFGQLHSHTNISDGSGSVEEAFTYASNVRNLDFLAVTDHSNSFDNEGSGVLKEDGSAISDEWAQGHAAAAAVTDGDFVGLYGFEMTWSNGLGHLNTFNTPGWQSRTQSQFTTQSTALQNYYDTLATVPESISQFNHPGTTFGDFSDFAHYSEGTDALITLIEVGNGEGAIGSSGYFPSYEYYTRALDKGWHVAPTNNQDNHKGLWGDSNTGRSVILADSLTEEAIYDALRNYRVYATEDNDLNIYYTLNGSIMGSMLDVSDVEETVSLSIRISDATDANIGRVEVIVNGGLSLASQSVTGAEQTVNFTVSSDYNYYYIKITQPDGDIAVTAPVWVGKVEAVGVSSLEAASALTIAGEEQTITAELFNNESRDLIVDSLVFTNKATGEVLYTDSAVTSVPAEGTASSSFGYTFPEDGIYTITVTVKGTLNGIEKTYTKDLEVTVMPAEITSRVIVDGTHYNDYVTGYYGGNTANMTSIAAEQGIQVHVETGKITAEMLEDCSLLVISAPAKKTGTANAGAYEAKPFEDDFIAMVADYVEAGGNVIVCGLADYQDKGAASADHHTAAQINKLLAAIGSTMSINDDEAYDEDNNGGQAYRLYPENFNTESQWTAGIVADQVYSQYSGCTVNVGEGTWLVKGFDTTYSIDSDNDSLGGIGKGEAVFLAVEQTAFGGNIFVAGGVFVSDFEVKAELDNIWDLPYANRTIYENILGLTRTQPEVTPIADVRASASEALGRIFVIEGYVTAGTANEDTKFFDAIYVQDETGGITVFPYSELGLENGTKVRITGYTDAYQGDIEIQIMTVEVLDEPKNVVTPEKVSNKDAMDYATNGGELLQVEGEVVEVILTSDGKGVSQFVVKDANGDLAKVFIDGYILSGTKGINDLASIVKVGNTVSAVGLLYMHPEGESTESVAVLRVRDCDEVILISEKVEQEDPTDPSDPTEPSKPTDPTKPSESEDEVDTTELEKAIDKAKDLKKSKYTTRSYNKLQTALKKAKAVLADKDSTQAEVDAAAKALNDAIKALVPTTGSNVQTGDDTPIALYAGAMLVSALALVVLLMGRKRSRG